MPTNLLFALVIVAFALLLVVGLYAMQRIVHRRRTEASA